MGALATGPMAALIPVRCESWRRATCVRAVSSRAGPGAANDDLHAEVTRLVPVSEAIRRCPIFHELTADQRLRDRLEPKKCRIYSDRYMLPRLVWRPCRTASSGSMRTGEPGGNMSDSVGGGKAGHGGDALPLVAFPIGPAPRAWR
jgi:hypothetical protein